MSSTRPDPRAPEFTLRIPTDDDAVAWFRLFDDPGVMRYISAGQVQTEEWYRDFVARQQSLAVSTGVCLFALVVPVGRPGASEPEGSAEQGSSGSQGPAKQEGSAWIQVSAAQGSPAEHELVAGFVGLQPWSREWGPVGRIEIGWRLGAAFQGRGLATAGARAALERGSARGIHSPIAMIDVENAASIRVATKLGMHRADVFEAPGGARVGMWGF